MAVLGEEGYLRIQNAWDVYFWSYRICYKQLSPWWIDGQRAKQPNVFPSFERTCIVTHLISSELIEDFDKRIGARLLDKYQKISKISRRKPHDGLSRQFSSSLPN